MTDEQIIQAVGLCANAQEDCRKCPLHSMYSANCIKKLMNTTLDLIKKKNAEVENLKADKEAFINGQITLQKNLPKVTLDRFEKNIKDVQFTLGQTYEIQCALEKTLKEMKSEVKDDEKD